MIVAAFIAMADAALLGDAGDWIEILIVGGVILLSALGKIFGKKTDKEQEERRRPRIPPRVPQGEAPARKPQTPARARPPVARPPRATPPAAPQPVARAEPPIVRRERPVRPVRREQPRPARRRAAPPKLTPEQLALEAQRRHARARRNAAKVPDVTLAVTPPGAESSPKSVGARLLSQRPLSRQDLQRAVILREILSPPVAVRDPLE